MSDSEITTLRAELARAHSDLSELKAPHELVCTELQDYRDAVRQSPLGLILAATDPSGRYAWAANPHPDFDPEYVLGRFDTDLRLCLAPVHRL